ncbi:MAG: zf-HC2 domain-containing protein [Oscillospiraceae bacterium]|nr:zf-HC2 domain-containing protein [Oscillospiraceae bacterium]
MSDNHRALRCEIVQDLLPLYHDGVVTDVTKQAVEAHLLECESCAMEHRLLMTALPVEPEAADARSGFAAFAKRIKKKRIFTAIAAAVLACAMLAAGLYILTQVPMIPISASEYQIYRVYRYEAEGEQYFFLMYTQPLYNTTTSGLYEAEPGENGDITLVINWRKPIISSKVGNTNPQITTTRLHGSDGTYDALRFNNTVIWSEEENGGDPIPAYVYDIHEGSIPGFSYNLDISGNHLKVFFDDGRIMEWDLEGNLLFDSASE